ncbi:hypothetical protein [Consotaella aegiceratis]|uniref:hypothetical protein n=1 Tax=Consotaella aegiceratis TaxID=3097961 RepID=UPI002F4281B7
MTRLRTRLRPAKMLTETGRFVRDCAVTDRTGRGARLRFFEPTELPERFVLYEERDASRRPVRTIWSAGAEAGVRFEGPAEIVDAAERERIAGRYYAVQD